MEDPDGVAAREWILNFVYPNVPDSRHQVYLRSLFLLHNNGNIMGRSPFSGEHVMIPKLFEKDGEERIKIHDKIAAQLSSTPIKRMNIFY